MTKRSVWRRLRKLGLGLTSKRRGRFEWTAVLLSVAVCECLGGVIATTQAQPPVLTQAEPRSFEKLKPPSVLFELGPVIPGLQEDGIPQGLAYVAKHDRLLVSHDFSSGPSVVSVLDALTGEMTATVALKESADVFHEGHVGGIAVVNGEFCVASDGKILRYDAASFLVKDSGEPVIPIAIRDAETRASFCTATKDWLFVGEYSYGILFPTDKSHHVTDRKGIKKRAWVCGYAAADLTGKPTRVLSVRQRVQGMCVAGDRIFLSVSYGRKNRSAIVEYRSPLGEPAHAETTLSDGTKVPLWFLDGVNFVREIDFPPMSEGIAMVGDRLAVLSESGATKYLKGGKGPLDRILLLDVGDQRRRE